MINEGSRFERRHVFYCDLLGFSQYTLSKFFEPAKCFHLFASLDRMVADASVKISPSALDVESGRVPDYIVEPEATYFSDGIVISTPATNVDAIWLCEAAARIQNQMCYHGFLVRGSIVTGDVYHSGNTIFGPAIVNAVTLDKSGEPPLILVSDETLKFFRRAQSDEDKEIISIREFQLIAREESVLSYIDPFWLCKIHTNQPSIHHRTRLNIASWRSLIETGLRKKEPGIQQKYLWMARRFNRCLCNKPSAVQAIPWGPGSGVSP